MDTPIGQFLLIGNFRRRLARELLVKMCFIFILYIIFCFSSGTQIHNRPIEPKTRGRDWHRSIHLSNGESYLTLDIFANQVPVIAAGRLCSNKPATARGKVAEPARAVTRVAPVTSCPANRHGARSGT